MNKQELRIWAKNKRKELDIDNISSILVKKIKETDFFKQAKNIMIFYPLSYELNLLSLLNVSDKYFYLPRINGQELECCRYKLGDELRNSCFKTKEPVCPSCNSIELDTIILPALCCDKNKYRLGYGGGFYDRFLKNNTANKICCIPETLLMDTIYPESHDIKADIIITEKSIIV